jgi:hypothetical protein
MFATCSTRVIEKGPGDSNPQCIGKAAKDGEMQQHAIMNLVGLLESSQLSIKSVKLLHLHGVPHYSKSSALTRFRHVLFLLCDALLGRKIERCHSIRLFQQATESAYTAGTVLR